MSPNEDNSKKAKHGQEAKKTLNDAIYDLRNLGAIKEAKNTPSYGYQDFLPNQFKADKFIELPNGETAVLFTAASLRSDRTRAKQWVAHNIKEISKVDRAYLILPDADSFKGVTKPRDEIREEKVFSAIDDIITVSEFYESVLSSFATTTEKGKFHDLAGKSLEKTLAAVLSNQKNLARWKGSKIATGYMYDLFILIVNKLNLSPKYIEDINATTNIPKLPNGGNPKTDVLMRVKFTNGDIKSFTFSLKNSSKNSVSVHQYSANTFADVLNKNDPELRRLLEAFQDAGSKKDMNPIDAEDLQKVLVPYLGKLNRWVFGGYGGKHISEDQLAQFLLTHDRTTNKYSVHSVDEYIKALEQKKGSKGGFGTLFEWTYPSKKRGKSIQLKAKILPPVVDF